MEWVQFGVLKDTLLALAQYDSVITINIVQVGAMKNLAVSDVET